MLSGRRLETIGYDDVSALVESAYREDREIDYKSQLPELDGKRPADAKKELLKDVAAFANAGGGDIVFGIEEERDDAGKPYNCPEPLMFIFGESKRAPRVVRVFVQQRGGAALELNEIR